MLILFWILAIAVVMSALAVVALRNPLHSALALVCNLLSVAGLYAMLQAHFLAAAQIIIYAGAIMVLVVFVLMLLNSKLEQPRAGGRFLTVLSVLLGLCFSAVLVPLLYGGFEGMPVPPPGESPLPGTAQNIGRKLFSEYVFLFQAGGVLLLSALAGAVMLAARRGLGAAEQRLAERENSVF